MIRPRGCPRVVECLPLRIDRRVRAVGMERDDTDVECRPHWSDGEHALDVTQEDGDPARPVVDPLRVDDLGDVDAELLGDRGDEPVLDRT